MSFREFNERIKHMFASARNSTFPHAGVLWFLDKFWDFLVNFVVSHWLGKNLCEASAMLKIAPLMWYGNRVLHEVPIRHIKVNLNIFVRSDAKNKTHTIFSVKQGWQEKKCQAWIRVTIKSLSMKLTH